MTAERSPKLHEMPWTAFVVFVMLKSAFGSRSDTHLHQQLSLRSSVCPPDCMLAAPSRPQRPHLMYLGRPCSEWRYPHTWRDSGELRQGNRHLCSPTGFASCYRRIPQRSPCLLTFNSKNTSVFLSTVILARIWFFSLPLCVPLASGWIRPSLRSRSPTALFDASTLDTDRAVCPPQLPSSPVSWHCFITPRYVIISPSISDLCLSHSFSPCHRPTRSKQSCVQAFCSSI